MPTIVLVLHQLKPILANSKEWFPMVVDGDHVFADDLARLLVYLITLGKLSKNHQLPATIPTLALHNFRGKRKPGGLDLSRRGLDQDSRSTLTKSKSRRSRYLDQD